MIQTMFVGDLIFYTVFNVDQVEGLEHLRAGMPDDGELLTVDYQPAEDAIQATGGDIRYGGNEEFYRPSGEGSRRRSDGPAGR